MVSTKIIHYHLENTLDGFRTFVNPIKNNNLIIHQGKFDPEFFRWLYTTVGKPYRWWYYSKETVENLEKYLSNKMGYVLIHGSNPIGFALLEVENQNSINLSYFGITPYVLSLGIKGLGTYFLSKVIQLVRFPDKNHKLWVYTTEWDHPASLKTYQKVGFKLTKTWVEIEDVPEEVLNVPLSKPN